MRREDCALEVWLVGGSRPVGWLTNLRVGIDIEVRCDRVMIETSRIEDGEEIVESRPFTLGKRNTEISKFDLNNHGPRTPDILRDIPHYAESTLNRIVEATRFTWHALVVSQEDFEWVFELDAFEPADTVADQKAVMAERLESVLDDAMKRMADKFDADLFDTLVGGATSTSANQSTLTVESFEQSMRQMRSLIRRA